MEFLSGNTQRRLRSLPFYLVLIVTTVITLVPIVWVFASALKSNKEIRENPLALPSEWHFQNYVEAWFGASFDQYFFNSIFITVTSVAIVLFLSSLAAYAFAKMRFPGNQMIFFVFLIGMAFPLSAKLGPLLSLMYELNLANSRFGLILVYVAGSLPFAILMLRAFFQGFPQELEDSAALDGCNRFQFYWRILLPLSKPSLMALGIFVFMGTWNEFFQALLLINEDSKRTLPLGLTAFQDEYFTDFALSFAGINITAVPVIIVYIMFQRNLIEGITVGSLK
ncbi:MAG: carbohydrate ABC transporter permease [Chloroflexi bacterium]|nr:carbohydrate ABC transporter permease [Chloroflexota bacterium]